VVAVEYACSSGALGPGHGNAAAPAQKERVMLRDDTTGELLPVHLFIWMCDTGLIRDHHGYGHAVRDGKIDTTVRILPSERRYLRADISHVLWFDAFLPVGC
jgi:hypothetical protein